MLAQNNLQILGGEVEELFQTHNREAVLCSCLGRPVSFAMLCFCQTSLHYI